MMTDGFDALISMISRVISSHVASRTQTEDNAGTASFGAVLSSVTAGTQRVSFGDWTMENGTWYRSVTPPHQTRGVSYYADAEGNLYAKSVVPGAQMRHVGTPDWFSGMRPGNPPSSAVGSTNQQAAYTYGDTTTIGGKEYTAVVPPSGATRGSQYLVDSDGNWYRLSSAQGATPESVDAPSWWDRILPNGKTSALPSSSSASSASSPGFLRFGQWETIDGTMYRTVWQPGIQNRGGEYLIDRNFSWYYRTSAQGSVPRRIDTPEWFLRS